MNRTDYVLRQTCYAYPERYDVILDGKIVGDLHLRWGVFRADFLGEDGSAETVYTTNEQFGAAEFTDDERNHFLNMGVGAIDHHLHNPAPPKMTIVQNAKAIGWTLEVRQ